MAVGAIQGTPSVNDLELNFETLRFPVTLKTFQSATPTSPDMIVVRAEMPANMYANIYEVGIYPEDRATDIANRSNNILTDFFDLSNWTATAGNVLVTGFIPQGSNSPRIGGYSVELLPNTTYQNNTYNINMLGYSDLDTLQILAYNTVAGTLTVTLTDTYGNQYPFTYTLQNNDGYQVLSAPFPPGIHWTNTVNSISIQTDGSAVVTIDAIKASVTKELGSSDFIISKSSLNTPIAKNYGVPLDIEYYIQLL